ncbi:MAG: putative cysteine ligase BshC [Chitinophagales bacterium]|nr:MAG: putative cysteine ligase BshC [Chitinophagales bacterium]
MKVLQRLNPLQLNIYPDIIRDYLLEDKRLMPFYKYSCQNTDFDKIMSNCNMPSDARHVLRQALDEQYQNLPVQGAVTANIQMLNRPDCFTVTTAHQPVLFGGPLFFVYKIACAIHLAEHLKKTFPDKHFVPVYFIGAEDHDFEEVNHIYLAGEQVIWSEPMKGAVGRFSTRYIKPLIKDIKVKLHGPFASETVHLLEEAYSQPTLAQATLYLVHALFGRSGLVVVLPDTPQLKKRFTPVIQDELVQGTCGQLARETGRQLAQAGYPQQAYPRDINLFYLTDGLRARIIYEQTSNRYKVVGTDLQFSRDEILKLTEEHPERFSPNVMLRPLYQVSLLPDLAYIGGPGELAYWLQLKGIFDYYRVNFPMLALRNSALILEQNILRKMERNGIAFTELFEDEEKLIQTALARQSDKALDLTWEQEQMERLFDHIRGRTTEVDPTLAGVVEAMAANLRKGLQTLEKKMIRAEKKNQETTVAQIKSIKARLFPNGILQERVESFLPYYALEGHAFIQTLTETMDPLAKQFVVLGVDA